MPSHIHAHPVTVIGNLWRVRYFIVIPVIRGFVSALGGGGLAGWVAGAWLDILILLLMVGIAVLRWRSTRLWWDDKLLHIRSGLILRTHTVLPWKRIVTLGRADTYYLRPFGAIRLRVDTLGGRARTPDFTILLSRENAAALGRCQMGAPSRKTAFSPSTISILAQSLLSSNSIAGIVFAATFVSQSGRLLGDALTGEIVGVFEQAARTLALGIPPAAAALALLLLVGWAVSFLRTFCSYKDMQASVCDGRLRIKRGLISKREVSINCDEVGYLSLRQSLLMRSLGLCALYISAVGCAGRSAACLVPAAGSAACVSALRRFFPHLAPAPASVTPGGKGALRFIMAAVWPLVCIPLVCAALLWAVPDWRAFILFTGGMAMAPALYFFALRVTDFRTSGAGKKGDVYTLRYSKGFSLHTVVAQRAKIVQIQLRQSWFQRRTGRCDVIIHTKSQGRSLHLLRGLPLQKTRKLFT